MNNPFTPGIQMSFPWPDCNCLGPLTHDSTLRKQTVIPSVDSDNNEQREQVQTVCQSTKKDICDVTKGAETASRLATAD